MSTRKILFSCLVLLIILSSCFMSPGGFDTSAEVKRLVTGIDPNTLIQNIAGKEMSIARVGGIRGTLGNPIIAPNNLIRDVFLWKEVSVAQSDPGRRGLPFILFKNKDAIGHLRIGIFADNKSAVEKFEEKLRWSSVGPDKDLSKEVGDKAFGWSAKRVDFVRDNVTVGYSKHYLNKLTPTGAPEDTVLAMAKAIDEALVKGLHGVRRDSAIRMPRFSKVELPEDIIAGKVAEGKVHITLPPDVNGGSEIEIIKSLRFRAPSIKSGNSESVSYEITYVTPNCVVTSKQVALTITRED